ncbi:disease resistance RPP13-like protein 4 [Cinnamomum micranthum f. kanehirae]|uniref:Disease resistance RPP13-like protein 4 n=1 Tax=Cinnamomum micranthum f. kanehirae TaxID=337451 RepID=A0A3S3QGS7_9MAGN|nr:disease resistance RPP13-like protein 4 [Cinnamomum micranthum f. kanehirae]
METGKEEESFKAFLRKIQGLGSKFSSEVEGIKNSLEHSTVALYATKKWEKKVLDELSGSIRKIDDLIERYEYNTSQSDPESLKREKESQLDEIITNCVQQIKEHMARFKEGEEIPEEKNNGINGTQGFIPPEDWLKTAEKNVKGKLQVTAPNMRYDDLEPPLKRCLLFLSVFPKDAVIKKSSIIYWWIGEGLVKPNKVQTAEQAGEQCFKMLLLNGLILPISKKHDKKARCCKLHDGVRDMLTSQVKEAGLCFKNFSSKMPTEKTNEDDKRPISYLAATTNEQSVMVSLEHSSNEFLSLFNISAQYLICDSNKFSEFKSIKILQLGRWQVCSDHHIEVADTKFLESLGVMKNLRYLSLQGISRITMLSDSLVHLTNLRILDLRACHNLETLPTGIGSLKHLTHLDVSECSLLDRIPKGLSSLSELQVLKGFVISRGITSDSCRLKDLAGLKKLKKLSINIARGAKANDDLMELKTFDTLSSLTITWGQVTETPSLEISLPNLEKLDLQCLPQLENLKGLKSGGFPKLKRLYIRGGKLKSLNPTMTETEPWHVDTLRLKFLSELELDEWSNLERTFPSLAYVEIYKCPKVIAKPLREGNILISEEAVWEKNNEGGWIQM